MNCLRYTIALATAVILSMTVSRAQDSAQPAAEGTEVTGATDAEEPAAREETAEEKSEGKVNASGIILGHVKDSYEWHFWGSGEKTVAIYLPVILHSKVDGKWHCFSSRKVAEGETFEGFYIAPEGTKHEGKIVEKNAAGEEIRPLDISITKTVLGLLINSIVVLVIVLCTARWYRRNDALEKAPRGIAALIEPVIIFIEDEVIKDSVGPEYKKFTPYLLTVFFFILGNNLMGIIPFFPGGANVTGNIAITFTLAICTFLCVNLTTNKHYWKDIFWPDTPWWLKVPLPLMPLVEVIGMFTKPFALMVRLFANILAGHSMILSIVCVVFLTHTMGAALNGTLSAVSVIFGVFVDVIEVLVAFLQAYVFTMLSAVFIGLSHPHPEHELSTEKTINK